VASYTSGSQVPLTANGLTANGTTVSFALNYAPATGAELMVVKNTSLDFINGTFDNLTNGQPVLLSWAGVTYSFVANYYGGSGNDLVLVWANNRPFAWGNNGYGQLGDNTTAQRQLPVPVTATGVLAGKVVVAITKGVTTAWRCARMAPWLAGATTKPASSATTPPRSATCRWP
jgi:hypothetical protein